jgi:hypothetical protein
MASSWSNPQSGQSQLWIQSKPTPLTSPDTAEIDTVMASMDGRTTEAFALPGWSNKAALGMLLAGSQKGLGVARWGGEDLSGVTTGPLGRAGSPLVTDPKLVLRVHAVQRMAERLIDVPAVRVVLDDGQVITTHGDEWAGDVGGDVNRRGSEGDRGLE